MVLVYLPDRCCVESPQKDGFSAEAFAMRTSTSEKVKGDRGLESSVVNEKYHVEKYFRNLG